MNAPREAGEDEPASSRSTESGQTGLPWLATWRQLYLFVLAAFFLWLVLLFALSVSYS